MAKTVFVYHILFPQGSGRGPYRYVGMGRKMRSTGEDGETISIAVGGDTYEHTPSSINHSRLVHEELVNKQSLTLTLPLTDPLSQDLAVNGVVPDISVTVFAVDLDDPFDTPLSRAVVWKGRITGISSKDAETAIEVESIITRLRREGNRARYSKTCRHALYGPGCGLNRNNFQETRVAGAVSNDKQRVIISNFSGGFNLSGGIVDFQGVLYYVLDYTGNVATLDRPSNISEGDTVTIHPGCARVPGDCLRFNNIINYGGFPFIPRDNPFVISELV